MNSHITVGELVFKQRVHAVKIKSSRKTLTDTATIALPNMGKMLESNIRVGNPVVIKLGYDEDVNLREEFVGYVAAISPKSPFELICEDEMWQRKQESVKPVSWKTTTLKAALQYLIPSATIEVPDVTLTGYRIAGKQTSVARVLKDLKSSFGLDIYYRGKTLYVGLALTEDMGTVVYHFQKNLPFNQSALEYVTEDSIRLKVEAESIQHNNKKIKVEVGDPDGEKHTLHYYNISESQLRKLAEDKLRLLKYDGYRGSFKAKGQPLPVHGMIAHLIDEKHTERNGEYFIDEVVTTYDNNGFNRTIKPGYQV